jgi:hypothetical protein
MHVVTCNCTFQILFFMLYSIHFLNVHNLYFVLIFSLIALWRYNSHAIQFIHLKYESPFLFFSMFADILEHCIHLKNNPMPFDCRPSNLPTYPCQPQATTSLFIELLILNSWQTLNDTRRPYMIVPTLLILDIQVISRFEVITNNTHVNIFCISVHIDTYFY